MAMGAFLLNQPVSGKQVFCKVYKTLDLKIYLHWECILMQVVRSYGHTVCIVLCLFYSFCFWNFSNRTNTTYHLSTIPVMTASIEETNNTMHEYIPFQERNDWVWFLTFLGVGVLIFVIIVPVIMFCQKMNSKGKLQTIIS